jgi:hypothetical protein
LFRPFHCIWFLIILFSPYTQACPAEIKTCDAGAVAKCKKHGDDKACNADKACTFCGAKGCLLNPTGTPNSPPCKMEAKGVTPPFYILGNGCPPSLVPQKPQPKIVCSSLDKAMCDKEFKAGQGCSWVSFKINGKEQGSCQCAQPGIGNPGCTDKKGPAPPKPKPMTCICKNGSKSDSPCGKVCDTVCGGADKVTSCGGILTPQAVSVTTEAKTIKAKGNVVVATGAEIAKGSKFNAVKLVASNDAAAQFKDIVTDGTDYTITLSCSKEKAAPVTVYAFSKDEKTKKDKVTFTEKASAKCAAGDKPELHVVNAGKADIKVAAGKTVALEFVQLSAGEESKSHTTTYIIIAAVGVVLIAAVGIYIAKRKTRRAGYTDMA